MEALPRRPRIADVALAAGVSKTAVSFAFNRPERLNRATADRILHVASTLGYRPDPVARMLTLGQTMTMGVLTPQALARVFRNPWFGHFGEGIAAAADAAGYGLHFVSPLQGSLARALNRASVDGFVAVGLSREHPELGEIRRAGLPMALVDSDAIAGYGSVDSDDESGAAAAAEHLLALGHRRLLVIGIERALGTTRAHGGITARRLAGYRQALADAGVEPTPKLMVLGPATVEGGQACLRRAWAAGLGPTGVLAMSDAMAIGALRAARERGLRVPQDLSIVGFDDIGLADLTDPPLTTVHQPIRRKGEEAVRLLLLALAGRDEAVAHVRLGTRLVIRSSTGPAPPSEA